MALRGSMRTYSLLRGHLGEGALGAGESPGAAAGGALLFSQERKRVVVAPGADPVLLYAYVVVLDARKLLVDHDDRLD